MGEKARVDWHRLYLDCCAERASYGDKMTGKLIDLEAEVKRLRDEIGQLAVGNLKAQHRAAQEGTRLREENARLRETLEKIAWRL